MINKKISRLKKISIGYISLCISLTVVSLYTFFLLPNVIHAQSAGEYYGLPIYSSAVISNVTNELGQDPRNSGTPAGQTITISGTISSWVGYHGVYGEMSGCAPGMGSYDFVSWEDRYSNDFVSLLYRLNNGSNVALSTTVAQYGEGGNSWTCYQVPIPSQADFQAMSHIYSFSQIIDVSSLPVGANTVTVIGNDDGDAPGYGINSPNYLRYPTATVTFYVGKSTINVVESGGIGGTWTINPGGYTGSPNTVSPNTYNISVNTTPPGCSVFRIDSDVQNSSSLNIAVNQTKSFTINYTCAAISLDLQGKISGGG